MNDLSGWCAALRNALPAAAVPEVSPEAGNIQVVVWEEDSADVVRAAAARIGIPADVLRITRPVTFLDPFPGDDARNEAAHAQFLADNVRTDDAGNMLLLRSMPPLRGQRVRVLVLGSMPGAESLRLGEYYANPRNRFWRMVGDVLGTSPDASYDARVAALNDAGIALWDTLRHCSRVGSLDSAIVASTEVANDIAGFVGDAPELERIVFNGRKAADSFRRLVEPGVPGDGAVQLVTAPSTSAANARISYSQLLLAWQAALA